jgi:hypothetical protein
MSARRASRPNKGESGERQVGKGAEGSALERDRCQYIKRGRTVLRECWDVWTSGLDCTLALGGVHGIYTGASAGRTEQRWDFEVQMYHLWNERCSYDYTPVNCTILLLSSSLRIASLWSSGNLNLCPMIPRSISFQVLLVKRALLEVSQVLSAVYLLFPHYC